MTLVEFLKEQKDSIIKKVRVNVKREERGYSEWTRWMETVSFDEVETIDFDALMGAMEEFENSFKK